MAKNITTDFLISKINKYEQSHTDKYSFYFRIIHILFFSYLLIKHIKSHLYVHDFL